MNLGDIRPNGINQIQKDIYRGFHDENWTSSHRDKKWKEVARGRLGAVGSWGTRGWVADEATGFLFRGMKTLENGLSCDFLHKSKDCTL